MVSNILVVVKTNLTDLKFMNQCAGMNPLVLLKR